MFIGFIIWMTFLSWCTVPIKADIRNLNYQIDVIASQQEEDRGHINILASKAGLSRIPK